MNTMQTHAPLAWRPQSPADLVGQPREVAAKLLAKIEAIRARNRSPVKLLLIGPPGVGKTTIAQMVAKALAPAAWNTEEENGKCITVDVVKDWIGRMHYSSLYGDWSVKIVNELDRCSRDAQDLMLSYLDKLPEGRAFIGTTNLDLTQLTERFQTRFQAVKLKAPAAEEIAQMLITRWQTPEAVAKMIAVGSGGCVRAALADLENYLDSGRSL